MSVLRYSVLRRLPSAFRSQPFRSIQRCRYDALIPGTAAEIAGDGDTHFLLGRIGIVAQEFGERGEHSRRAEAALQAVIVTECLLQRRQLTLVRGEALDGGDVMAVRLHR